MDGINNQNIEKSEVEQILKQLTPANRKYASTIIETLYTGQENSSKETQERA